MSLKVSIKDKNTLVLNENGKVGDEIDLRELQNVDLSTIEEKIRLGRDEVYERFLKEERAKLGTLKEKELLEAKKPLEDQIKDLKNDLKTKNEEIENKLLLKEKEVELKYQKELSELTKQLELSKKEFEIEKEKIESDNIKKNQKLLDEINALRNKKAAFGSKMTGENLEIYCNNVFQEASQNGFNNCKWYKDTTNVKEEGETKGSKADYIFEIYANDECKNGELLANVCLEMKDENPDSKIKQTNESFYKQLDKNREKKNCKYALLVSNLEMDAPNDLPIKKIKEYKDMYMVRPGYMMTFLNMITSLTLRFQALILKDYEHDDAIKKQSEFLEEFERIKASYLEKPLEQLSSKVAIIQKQADTILQAGTKIQEQCDDILDKYIDIIKNKLDSFTINVGRSYKRLNKKGD